MLTISNDVNITCFPPILALCEGNIWLVYRNRLVFFSWIAWLHDNEEPYLTYVSYLFFFNHFCSLFICHNIGLRIEMFRLPTWFSFGQACRSWQFAWEICTTQPVDNSECSSCRRDICWCHSILYHDAIWHHQDSLTGILIGIKSSSLSSVMIVPMWVMKAHHLDTELHSFFSQYIVASFAS